MYAAKNGSLHYIYFEDKGYSYTYIFNTAKINLRDHNVYNLPMVELEHNALAAQWWKILHLPHLIPI